MRFLRYGSGVGDGDALYQDRRFSKARDKPHRGYRVIIPSRRYRQPISQRPSPTIRLTTSHEPQLLHSNNTISPALTVNILKGYHKALNSVNRYTLALHSMYQRTLSFSLHAFDMIQSQNRPFNMCPQVLTKCSLSGQGTAEKTVG